MQLRTPDRGQGWKVVATGGDGHQLIQRVSKVDSLINASTIAAEIAELTTSRGHDDTTQLGISSFEVSVRMSTPVDGWWNDSQQKLAQEIDKYLRDKQA